MRVKLLLNGEEVKSQDVELENSRGNEIKLKCTAPGKPGEHKHVELTPEEQEEIKKAAATPLIDVDKVIGEAKELHAMRPIEIEVFTRDTQVEESKEKRQKHKKKEERPQFIQRHKGGGARRNQRSKQRSRRR